MLPDFEYLRPATAAEAADLARLRPDGCFVAGGTDLIANLRRGLGRPQALIDLSAVRGLARIEAVDGGLTIGAGVTLADLAADEIVARDFPVLAAAAGGVAGATHRFVATVGGNLCQDTRCVYYNQSDGWRRGNDGCLKYEGDVCHVAPGGERCWAAYCGDLAPALMVLGATLDVTGAEGTRRLALARLFEDDGRHHLRLAAGEFVQLVRLPAADGVRAGYAKARVRRSIDFPLAGVAVALRRDQDRLAEVRLALTGTNCCPVLIDDAESLCGHTLDEPALEALGRMVKARIQPMGSSFTTHQYRRRVAVNLALRLARELYEGQVMDSSMTS